MAARAAGLLAGIAGMQAGEERLLQLDVPTSPQQQVEGTGELMACQVSMKELLWRDTPEVLLHCPIHFRPFKVLWGEPREGNNGRLR